MDRKRKRKSSAIHLSLVLLVEFRLTNLQIVEGELRNLNARAWAGEKGGFPLVALLFSVPLIHAH